MTHPLDRKLRRDLWRIRGQVLAIALIMASGIGVLVMGLATLQSLQETAQAYYERYRFGHVFANFTRAPQRIASQVAALPGVQSAETRVVRSAVLDIGGFDEPVVARLVSVPTQREPRLNLLAIRAGRSLRAHAPDEVLISEPFAQAHGLQVGASLRAVLNGTWRELRVVGIALSPEYVYAIGPGALMPDDARFGVLWMDEAALQAAFDLTGACNDLSVGLLRGADPQVIIEQIDDLLQRYGGAGAYARADQLSNWFLTNEIAQLRRLSLILPAVFLTVAAFLTNMVLARLIAVERSEIGLLKAFGYGRGEVSWHYTKFVFVIGGSGVLLGWVLGYWLGRYETRTYAEFYHFPFLLFRPGVLPFIVAALIGFGAALAGALRAVAQAVRLAPAEAMRPPAPPLFQRTVFARLPGASRIEQLTRIIVRQVARWPARSLTTCAGIAMSIGVLIMALQWLDAIEHMVDVYFKQAQSQDFTVSFVEPRSMAVLQAVGRLPGVLSVEPLRIVPAKLRSNLHEQREALQGLPARQELYRAYDASGHALSLPPEGLLISSMLAQLLAVGRGDLISVELLEGRRDTYQVPVADIFETYIGSPAYIEIGALGRLLRERPLLNSVHLRVDARQQANLLRALQELPGISAISSRSAAIRTFDETMARTMLIFVSFFIVFSCALAFGVTYNAARIALSERGRELATLRVLGFSRAEISYLLLGETALLTCIALPLGCGVGWLLARWIDALMQTELFRVPTVIGPASYGWSMLVGLAATVVSALLVRRRLDHLDLIAVLKTRE